jgi:transposase
MGRVVIGTDPHKRSATIEVRDEREMLLATGRFGMDKTGYRQLLGYVRQWPQRVWAVEGANGAGRPLAARLLTDGESVWDVPAKLAARVRVFDTGHGRKTDATDAHSIAMVALRTRGLRQLRQDEDLAVLRLLADRRDELSRSRTRTLNRVHRLLAELVGGGAPRHLSVLQAKALLATVRPRDPAGRTRRALAAELIGELEVLDGKLKSLKRRLAEAVTTAGSGLMDVYGIGPAGAARILADVADVARFADRNRFASWTGTAPIDASSGEQIRHRLSRAGNRRMNHVLYIAAVVQIRHDTPGRAYYRRKLAEGKTPLEALRCLRRRLSDVVYRQLVTDAEKANQADQDEAGPGEQRGATNTQSSAAGPTPTTGTSDKPQPGPAPATLPADQAGLEPPPASAATTTRRRDRGVNQERWGSPESVETC